MPCCCSSHNHEFMMMTILEGLPLAITLANRIYWLGKEAMTEGTYKKKTPNLLIEDNKHLV